jgi:NAD(P)-dependent dehydrogenase (short-subunit alcohol dehydrogenase family)
MGLLDGEIAVITGAGSAGYGRKSVRVNCICPGFIETQIMGASGGSVAAFPGSDRASFVSGAIIPVDGGWSARLP